MTTYRPLVEPGVVAGDWWHRLGDGRFQCDVCPRYCKLRSGQRGFCFVREARSDGIVLTSYGRASGYCVDPIEKKPLNHFHPGSTVLSFGTAGCNLGCRFCQNWDISKATQDRILAAWAQPGDVARAALGEALAWLKRATDVWLEVTTLLIPGHNDSDDEVRELCKWLADNLGLDVPLHFSAFHPSFRMMDVARTSITTLRRARDVALAQGLRYVYTGNVRDRATQSTYCSRCGECVVAREVYQVLDWGLDAAGRCRACGEPVPGRFRAAPAPGALASLPRVVEPPSRPEMSE